MKAAVSQQTLHVAVVPAEEEEVYLRWNCRRCASSREGCRLSLILKSGLNLRRWRVCFGDGSVARSLLFRQRLYKTWWSVDELLLRGDNQLKLEVVVFKNAD